MYMQLEDEFGDVVSKARRGQEISVSLLDERVGLTKEEIDQIESYLLTPPKEVVEAIAGSLDLDGFRRAAIVTASCRSAESAFSAGSLDLEVN